MPFEDYMQKYVFEPLDMKYSTFNQQDFLLNTKSAMGHGKTSLVKYPISMIGAGGMYTCPNDMAHFIMCFLNNGVYSDKKIIEAKFLQQMYSEYPASNEYPYNLGLVAGIHKNRVLLNHNGGGFGFYATQDILVNEGLEVAALTNSAEHSGIQTQICRYMWDDLLDIRDASKDDCEMLDSLYDEFIGLYEGSYNGGTWKLGVIPRNAMLYCNNQKLLYHSGNLFFTDNNDCIEFTNGGVRYNYILCKQQCSISKSSETLIEWEFELFLCELQYEPSYQRV